MTIISILFFLSGFAALSYEVLWQRDLGLIFGNTVHSAATVTSAYMAGIALGAYLAGKLSPRLKNPIRTFGALQLGIGLYALAVPYLFHVLRMLYRLSYQHISDDLPFLTVLRLILGFIVLLVPTMLMGATLPVLCKGLAARTEKFGARLGVLYGANTLGAVAGVVSCAFVMIPRLGMTGTRFAAVGVSCAVGLLAMVVSVVLGANRDVREATEPLEMPSSAVDAASRGRVRLLLFAAAASGFLGLAFEVVWFRTLILVFGSTTYSFSTMLGIFLLGISLGAVFLGWLADRTDRPALLFSISAMTIGCYSLTSLYWFTAMPDFLLRRLLDGGFSWENMILSKVMIAAIFLFLPAVCFGVSFTAVGRAVRTIVPSSSRAVGAVTAFNTVGAALGALSAGFVLLPLFGMEKTLVFLSIAVVAIGVCVGWSSVTTAIARASLLLLCVVCCVVAVAMPPAWNNKILTAGPYFTPWQYVAGGSVRFRETLQSSRLLVYREGRTSTISTVLGPDEVLAFSSNGKVEADTAARSMVLQRMMGHLPMLFHPNPKKVMNIGLGAGVTFGALGCYPVDHLEVIEIEPEVQHVARAWGVQNHNVVDREDAIITINDGRNHLFATAEKYDVITSDPFEPVMAGAANLYTVEHFEQAKRCLATGGIMAQFLPLYELSKEDYLIIARSFAHVFPRSILFFTGFDTVLLGFSEAAPIDMDVARRNYEIPQVRSSLSDIGFVSAEMILGTFVADLSKNPELIGTGTLNRDNDPVIEFSAPRSTLHYTPDQNLQALRDCFTPAPAEITAGLTEEQREGMQAEHDAMALTLEAGIARAKQQGDEVLRLLQNALQLAPHNPMIRNEMVVSLTASADALRVSGDFRSAWLQYQIALQFHPDEFWPLYHLVGLAMQNRNVKAAKKFLDAGLAAYPDAPLFIALRGCYKGTMGDPAGACDDLEKAIEILPARQDFWRDYAFFLSEKGDSVAAAEAEKEAKRLKNSIL